MTNRAWVTLATNDSYGLGALVLAHSLRRVGSTYPAVVLITPSVTDAMRERLRAVFAEVITVDVLDSQDAAHLALLQRPELGITFTKIHCWNLTQYEKCVFLDADVLVVQNCDELFEREELSAAPDVGWPDCFNSGVFVFTPSADTFSRLITFAQERGSFDGGDQGLLNSFFSGWSSDNNKRLPFLYNVTSAAFYSYLPALKHFGQNLKIIHFIGPAKPWLQHYNFESQNVDAPEHLKGFLQVWWNLFTSQVHCQLDETMGNLEEPPEGPTDVMGDNKFLPDIEQRLNYATYEPVPDPASEFPWHHPDKQIPDHELQDLHVEDFIDPWDMYRGNIPPIPDPAKREEENPDLNEIRQIAWRQTSPVIEHSHENISYQHTHHHIPFEGNSHNNCNESYNNTPQQETFQHTSDNHTQDTHSFHNFYHDDYIETIDNSSIDKLNQEPQIHHAPKFHTSPNDYTHKKSFPFNTDLPLASPNHVYCVHMDHEKPIQKLCTPEDKLLNGEVSDEDNIYEDIPRHPYDGYYLRHRATIDSRGKKLCSHEIIPRSPSPFESLDEYEDAIDPTENGYYSEVENETGVAGNLARVQPGVPLQREALDELSRRQGWESGNIDYMGADSFANIWAKISRTLSQGIEEEPSPAIEGAPGLVEEPVQELIQKAASISLDELNDIPVPAREAENAAGKRVDPVSECSPNIQVNVLASNPESVPSLESEHIITEVNEQTEKLVPKTTVPVIEQSIDTTIASQTEISDDTSKELLEPLISSVLHETPSESIPQVHDIVSKEESEVPKIDLVQSTDEHVPETSVVEPVTLAELPDNTKHATEVHESKEISSEVSSVNEKQQEPDMVSDMPIVENESHGSLSQPECVVTASEPASEPLSLLTEKCESSEPLVEQVITAIKADEPKLDTSSEIPSDTPALVPPVTPVQEKPDTNSAPETPKQETTPENTDKSVSDSPPLANTPSTDEVQSVPAAKLEERRRPPAKLQLKPPSVADPLPTPDSELEDAASLAQSIIASELRTPTVTSPSPPAGPTSPPQLTEKEKLNVKKADVPTPPVAAVSLSQIGVKSKLKPTIAAQIESSVTQKAVTEPTKKKVIKKVVKKDSTSDAEAPVPPPRKKEKKPKEN